MPDPTPQPAAPAKPDAVLIHKSKLAPGTKFADQFRPLQNLAISLMGLDATKPADQVVQARTQGEWYYIHPVGGGHLNFPKAHAKDGQTRYQWKEQQKGILLGFLTDDARADQAAARATPPSIPSPPVSYTPL